MKLLQMFLLAILVLYDSACFGRSSQCHQAALNQVLLHIALIGINRIAACIRWCSLFLSTHPGFAYEEARNYAPKLYQNYNHLQKILFRDIIWLEARQGFLHLSGSCRHNDGRGKLS